MTDRFGPIKRGDAPENKLDVGHEEIGGQGFLPGAYWVVSFPHEAE